MNRGEGRTKRKKPINDPEANARAVKASERVLWPHDPVRQDFYDELCGMIETWQEQHNSMTDELEQLDGMLNSAYALKEAMKP